MKKRFTGFARGSSDGVGELILTDSPDRIAHPAQIDYSIAPSPAGSLLIAATAAGACWIGIHDSPDYLERELRRDLPAVQLNRAAGRSAFAETVIAMISGAPFELPVDLSGAPFQLSVWRELCAIPRGATRSYAELARRIGKPAAVRAVGHANGANPLAVVIPCHRAIGSNGTLTGYRWGLGIKQRLLELEGGWPLQSALALTAASLSTGSARIT